MTNTTTRRRINALIATDTTGTLRAAVESGHDLATLPFWALSVISLLVNTIHDQALKHSSETRCNESRI